MEINLSYNSKNKNSNQKNNSKSKNIFSNIEKKIYFRFKKKYSKLSSYYNKYIINNIIYNEKSHIVAVFKDHLINDDSGDFLKRFYKKSESVSRLPKIYEYYELYSKIFPNYITLPEGKYLFQNILRKQKMIDLIEKLELNGKSKDKLKENGKEYAPEVLNTEIIDSILNGTNHEGMEIIFNVNKNNIKQEEINFRENINHLVKKINECEQKNLTNKSTSNNFFTKINVNKKITKSNIEKKSTEDKNKKVIQNLNSTTVNNTNIFYHKNISSIISKFFKVSPNKKKSLLNLKNNPKKYKNNSEIMRNCKIGKDLMEKIEKNLYKIKQQSSSNQKNLSQNLSTSNQTQRDISSTSRKKMYTKNSSNKNSYLQFNSSSNLIQSLIKSNNFNYSKKDTSPLTSKRSNNYKKITNMKQNIYFMSDTSSRNKFSKNKKRIHKSKSLIGSKNSNYSCHNIRNKNSINKLKKYNKNYLSPKNSCKKINTVRENNVRKNNNYNIKLKIISSRNKDNKKKFINISQPKTKKNICKNYVSRNESELKFVFNITNIKNQFDNRINVENYSNFLNPTKNKFVNSNTNKNSFICHTQRKNYKN